MKDVVGDLRVLRLARMYEEAFAAFVESIAGAPARDDHGARLAASEARLRTLLEPEDIVELARSELLDVVEVERAARAIYLRFADEVHDPALARLFRELAAHEVEHVRRAQAAVSASRNAMRA